jgi:small-conductance mechanosensitive channel
MNLKDLTASLGQISQRRPKKEQTLTEETELKRLDRIRLMELIVDQRKKIEELEEKLTEVNSRLDARTIRLDIDHVEDKRELSRMLRLVLRELEGTFGTN